MFNILSYYNIIKIDIYDYYSIIISTISKMINVFSRHNNSKNHPNHNLFVSFNNLWKKIQFLSVY
jgi:hypothetical protein